MFFIFETMCIILENVLLLFKTSVSLSNKLLILLICIIESTIIISMPTQRAVFWPAGDNYDVEKMLVYSPLVWRYLFCQQAL